MASEDTSEDAEARLSVVVPAGGAGTRLWPLSRPDRPKFLLDLFGSGRSLLQDTVARMRPLAARTVVVTGIGHVPAVRDQLPDSTDDDILAEPTPRDSMAAIGLAAAVLEERHGPHVIGSFAADHVVRRPEVLLDSVRAAIAAASSGSVVTIGIAPGFASTGFGWVQRGDDLPGVPGAWRAVAFHEKPDAATAERFLAAGDHYWNAGMYIVRTDVLLGHLERLRPELHRGLRTIAAAWDGPRQPDVLASVWPDLERIAIDHAIAEPVAAEGGVAVVPSDCDWIDVGDFSVLASLVEADSDGVRRLDRAAPVLALDSPGAMVVGGDKPVAIVGLEDVTVVETVDALLVLGRAAAQRVKDAAGRQA